MGDVNVQHQVRNNAQRLQEELVSIKKFENEMKQKESQNLKENFKTKQNDIPVRSDVRNFQKYAEEIKKEEIVKENNTSKKDIANRLKEKGNEFVKAKDYHSAIKMYSEAIEICEEAVYYSNRSQCFLNLEYYNEAIDDATRAILLDKSSSKAYYRRMIAYEKLNQNLKGLQNCQEWMIALPDDQIAKNSYDRIHNELIEAAKIREKDKIKWSKSLETTNFIDKHSYTQSTKSLKKINVSIKKSHSPIPEYIIDKIFNNNTGENTSVELDTDSKYFKSNALDESSNMNAKSMPKNEKNIVNETNEMLKSYDKKSIMPLLPDYETIKNDSIPPPQTGPQFYAVWKELSEDKRFVYLKSIAENNVKFGTLIGALMDSQLLSEIIKIIHKYFFAYNIPYINLIYELSMNSELSVLAMFLDNDDKEKLQKLLDVLQVDNDLSDLIQKIKQNFQV